MVGVYDCKLRFILSTGPTFTKYRLWLNERARQGIVKFKYLTKELSGYKICHIGNKYQKMNKYEHFITDITTRDVSVHPFEIGSNGLKTLLFRVFVEWGGKRFLG